MLDNTNKLPLYVQLVNTLLEQIQNDMSQMINFLQKKKSAKNTQLVGLLFV